MSSRDDRRDDRRDEDLEARLDELEEVLTELRRDLRETERGRRAPLQPPRPPRLSELVRFTEEYTIPTIIALLETTIKSLELLQGTLRLADPSRSVADDASAAGDRLADVRDGASAGLARSLSELRTALSEADLPEEAASRSIVSDARNLTAEIEDRIEEGRREADDARRDRRSDEHGGARIDVTDPDADRDADGDEAEPANDADPAPEVDVESELESIKRRLDDEESGVTGRSDEGSSAAGDDERDSDSDDSDVVDSDVPDSDEAN
ncbi:DUF7547 family protein [Halorubrum trueperi]|uniref:Uncharacterized protein n=1 Tax=Halorubrum trueperi TaxID=2004704 RepID=A0ABD5UIT1_9EURY